MSMKLQWREDLPPSSVEDVEQLASLLGVVAKQASPERLTIANLCADSGDTLSIVLGGADTVLSFTHGHGDPPYYASQGASDDIEPRLTCYLFMTHHTEFPRRCVIPIERGLAAAREFLQTGRRPEVIEWEEV